MARLTYAARKSMPRSEFALPAKRQSGKGGYPIEDKAHARNALARVAQHGTSAEKAEVRAKVHRKYPSIGDSNMAKSEKRSHHGSTEGLHERGAHDSHVKEHERTELSHKDFEAMDHGGEHDHMIGRGKGPY